MVCSGYWLTVSKKARRIYYTAYHFLHVISSLDWNLQRCLIATRTVVFHFNWRHEFTDVKPEFLCEKCLWRIKSWDVSWETRGELVRHKRIQTVYRLLSVIRRIITVLFCDCNDCSIWATQKRRGVKETEIVIIKTQGKQKTDANDRENWFYFYFNWFYLSHSTSFSDKENHQVPHVQRKNKI